MLKRKLVIVIFIGFFLSNITEAAPKKDKGKGVATSSYDPTNVWTTFDALDKYDNEVVEYQIRNVPSERFEEALNLRQKLLEDKTICRFLGITINDSHIKKSRAHWKSLLNKNMSIACFNNDDEMVGLAILYIGKQMDTKGVIGIPTVRTDESMEF
ncbi:uncharacterized protein LOC116350444 [Contarinia nasturtii]|uniref:uncharacterized protein LOC116350444 n=1 Tax=Contarinia nasturtii TaxID=265458 RepID=UPI0012D476A7|nr:uncharacterized protein LOC116350444 [Contarinia nasturtii]